jgi:hypothetical protein
MDGSFLVSFIIRRGKKFIKISPSYFVIPYENSHLVSFVFCCSDLEQYGPAATKTYVFNLCKFCFDVFLREAVDSEVRMLSLFSKAQHADRI